MRLQLNPPTLQTKYHQSTPSSQTKTMQHTQKKSSKNRKSVSAAAWFFLYCNFYIDKKMWNTEKSWSLFFERIFPLIFNFFASFALFSFIGDVIMLLNRLCILFCCRFFSVCFWDLSCFDGVLGDFTGCWFLGGVIWSGVGWLGYHKGYPTIGVTLACTPGTLAFIRGTPRVTPGGVYTLGTRRRTSFENHQKFIT